MSWNWDSRLPAPYSHVTRYGPEQLRSTDWMSFPPPAPISRAPSSLRWENRQRNLDSLLGPIPHPYPNSVYSGTQLRRSPRRANALNENFNNPPPSGYGPWNYRSDERYGCSRLERTGSSQGICDQENQRPSVPNNPNVLTRQNIERASNYGGGALYGQLPGGAVVTPARPKADIRNVKMKPLPFYDVLSTIIETHIVAQASPLTSMHFKVHPSEVKDCFHPETKLPTYTIMLRVCALDDTLKQPDYFPPSLQVAVNGVVCSLPGMHTIPQGPAGPMSLNHMCMVSESHTNVLTVKCLEYCKLFVQLLRNVTSQELIERLQEKPQRKLEDTITRIKEKFEEDQSGDCIASTELHCSLICPLSRTRMKYPCRASTCSHFQCFDGAAYIQMNESKPKWSCPVCYKPAVLHDLQIDEYFMKIIEKKISSETVMLLPNGSWTEKQDQGTKKVHSVSVAGAEDLTVLLDSTDESLEGEQLEEPSDYWDSVNRGGCTAEEEPSRIACDSIEVITLSEDEGTNSPHPPEGRQRLSHHPPDGRQQLSHHPPEGRQQLSHHPPDGRQQLSSHPPEGRHQLSPHPPENRNQMCSTPKETTSVRNRRNALHGVAPSPLTYRTSRRGLCTSTPIGTTNTRQRQNASNVSFSSVDMGLSPLARDENAHEISRGSRHSRSSSRAHSFQRNTSSAAHSSPRKTRSRTLSNSRHQAVQCDLLHNSSSKRSHRSRKSSKSRSSSRRRSDNTREDSRTQDANDADSDASAYNETLYRRRGSSRRASSPTSSMVLRSAVQRKRKKHS